MVWVLYGPHTLPGWPRNELLARCSRLSLGLLPLLLKLKYIHILQNSSFKSVQFVVFSVVTGLYNRYYYLIPEHVYRSQRKLCIR